MMKRSMRVLSIGAMLLLSASQARAQLPWETPQLLAPHAPRGMSMLAAAFATGPGDGWGALLAWRAADAPTGLGFHIVAGRGSGDRDAIGGGIDASAWLAHASRAFPLDIIWTSGIGGAVGQSAQVAIPVGFAAGRSLGHDGSVWFNPYGAARVTIEGRFGANAPDQDLELLLSNELGFNLSFDRERRFILRAAAALGDRSALVMGFHVGGGSRDALAVTR